ncbi:MAG: LLM class flavin-dependent oxidoreductase [Rothia sp. (in: high G+C Gram-positive bacteria)]|nr:LLM class flavin-dependent oxidoreductase [Rothia sp. (in: high G+C Gram-positive bacteria)]
MKLSLLDLSTVHPGEKPADAFSRSVQTAQLAEKLGYERIWYAEHHNMPAIASSAPAVLISHIAANTSTIRLGSGGVMLPNHSPLTIAEQFGTLAELYPGRIDIGLGRAPGTDGKTLRALRRDYDAAERFPQDVKELQGYLSGHTMIPGVEATPGKGTNVPLYILGSSLFGASLAAALGMPYAFASHFAPDMFEQAINLYREKFQPSEQLAEPYVIAAANFIAADTQQEAMDQKKIAIRERVRLMMGGAIQYSDEEIDAIIDSGGAEQITNMFRILGVGTGEEAADYITRFGGIVNADEMMLTNYSPSTEQALHGLELMAEQFNH